MRARWVLVAAFVLRVLLIFRYRFDSDEPQHMHVAWGWSHGLVQYRDIFDNHMPLFHLLTAPLFLGGVDDSRLLFAGRLLMLPLFVIDIALLWLIARKLFDATTAKWATVIAALFPMSFLLSLEYRTDDLWLVFWLAAIVVLLSDIEPRRRSLYAGLLVGGAFAVSMKTTVMLFAIAGAAIGTRLLRRSNGGQAPRLSRQAWTPVLHAGFFAAAASIPAAIFAVFALAGLWKPMWYDVVIHNIVPFEHAWRGLLFIPLYPAIRFFALRIEDRRRLFVFGCAALFLLALVVFWTRLADEDFLPLYPLLALLAAPLFFQLHRFARQACAAACAITILFMTVPWRDEAHQEIELVDEVLSITTPSDPVFDLKGESVFRVRPWYFGLETLTNAHMRLGEIRDTIADALVRSDTHVVVSDRLPTRARLFVEKNYIPWKNLFVAGSEILGSFCASDARRFHLAIPGRYVVLGGRALLDGIDADHGVYLAAGEHIFTARQPLKNPTVIWSGALRHRRH
jgi:hypothetical protein